MGAIFTLLAVGLLNQGWAENSYKPEAILLSGRYSCNAIPPSAPDLTIPESFNYSLGQAGPVSLLIKENCRPSIESCSAKLAIGDFNVSFVAKVRGGMPLIADMIRSDGAIGTYIGKINFLSSDKLSFYVWVAYPSMKKPTYGEAECIKLSGSLAH